MRFVGACVGVQTQAHAPLSATKAASRFSIRVEPHVWSGKAVSTCQGRMRPGPSVGPEASTERLGPPGGSGAQTVGLRAVSTTYSHRTAVAGRSCQSALCVHRAAISVLWGGAGCAHDAQLCPRGTLLEECARGGCVFTTSCEHHYTASRQHAEVTSWVHTCMLPAGFDHQASVRKPT